MEKIEDICMQSLAGIISRMASDPSSYAVNPGRDFTRNRILPFDKLMWGIMAMEGNSLNKELFDIFNMKGDAPFISKSVFVQQRNKLKHEAFERLFRDFNRETSPYDSALFNGYRLLAVDGSDLNIACNPDSDTYFGPECNRSDKGFNQFHLNVMYDLMNCVYTDAVIQPAPKEHEVEAARIMIRRLPESDSRSIIIADRGYASLDLMATVRDKKADFLFRIPNGLLTELRDMPDADFDIDLGFTIVTDQKKETRELRKQGKVKWLPGLSTKGKTKKKVTWFHPSPYRMELRVVRFRLDTGEYETIATSLEREEFSVALLKELYHKRWGIETSFRELKYAIGLTSFHARKEESIKQEIYARLVVYNFCTRITNSIVTEQKEDNIYEYQINVTQAVHICLCLLKHRLYGDIRSMIRKYIEPIRPGRKDTRKIKPKGAVCFNYRVA